MPRNNEYELKLIGDAVGPIIARLESCGIPAMAWSDIFTLLRLANRAGRIMESEKIYAGIELFKGKDPDEEFPNRRRRTRCRNPDTSEFTEA